MSENGGKQENWEEENEDISFMCQDNENATCKMIIWQLLEEELTCVTCDNLFVGPKTMPCLHTYCANCVESSVDTNTGDFTCAVCSTVFFKEQIADIPSNASISRLVAITKKRKAIEKTCEKAFDKDASDLTVTCEQCDEGAPAIWWCLVCDEAEMCEECYKSHCRLKVYKSHKVVPLRDFIQSPDVVLNCAPQPDFCQEHNKNPLDFYCYSCREFVCTACPCTQKKHNVETANNVCEVKRAEIKDLNESLWSLFHNADKAIQNNKSAVQKLNESVTKEINRVQQTFEEIRKLVDQHEEEILSGLETFKSMKEDLLTMQKTSLTNFKKRLSQCSCSVSNFLCPFRSKELFIYSKWITDKMSEVTQDKNADVAYETDDSSMLQNGSFPLDELQNKLSLLHYTYHPPHLPYCTVTLLNERLKFVEVEVLLRDQQNDVVSYQLPYLDFESDKPQQFFIDVDWKCREKGVYILSYAPSNKSSHNLAITWKGSLIDKIKIWEEGSSQLDYFDRSEAIDTLLTSQLSFDLVYLPNCKVNVLTNTLSFVKAEVRLNDKNYQPVSVQVTHLSINSELTHSYYTKADWEHEETGVYILLYTLEEKKPQKLTITWKGEVIGDIKIERNLFYYPNITKYSSIVTYNKKQKRRRLRNPTFLTNSQGALIVSDPNDYRLILFNEHYGYDRVINNDNRLVFKPSGTAVDPYGHLHVAISNQNCIMKFEKSISVYSHGCSFNSFSSSEFGNGWSQPKDETLQNPQGIVISKYGIMYICDQGNNRIQAYYIPEDGKGEFRFSYYGKAGNLFNHPTDLALNTSEDKLFVTDTNNDRVQVLIIDDPFTAELNYSYSIELTNMQSPFGVFCTVDGEVFVSAEDNVFVFKEDGSYVFAIDFEDEDPTGVTVNQRGMLAVSLSRNGKIVFYT